MELTVKEFASLTPAELYELLQLRVAVFVVEQNCPYQDLDGIDPIALHLFYRNKQGIMVAYLRIFPAENCSGTVKIGRVLTVNRRCGLGSSILQDGIRVAREQLHATHLILNAQTYAKGLYEKAGFRQTSTPFLEDGIPHIKMEL